ncbi:hypothetical protein WA158_006128 [Blastocystis sp. Blastoise]
MSIFFSGKGYIPTSFETSRSSFSNNPLIRNKYLDLLNASMNFIYNIKNSSSFEFKSNNTYNLANSHLINPERNSTIDFSSKSQLDSVATNKEVMLLFVTKGYIDFALMFYESSILKNNITNYIYVCGDHEIFEILRTQGINVMISSEIISDDNHIKYGSKTLNKIMENRLNTMIGFLTKGYSILNCDVDILLLDNPFHYFDHTYDANMSVEEDLPYRSINGGFFYLKAVPKSIQFLTKVIRTMNQNHVDDQLAINLVLKTMMKTSTNYKWEELDLWRYQDGRTFFYSNQYIFNVTQCKTCIMIHNNWIYGYEGKIYRMKELGIYTYNKQQYYNTNNQKYITFNLRLNDYDYHNQRDLLLLMSILSKQLNRILILPQFILLDTVSRQEEQHLKYGIEFSLHNKVFTDKKKNSNETLWGFTKSYAPRPFVPGTPIYGYRSISKKCHNDNMHIFKDQYIYSSLSSFLCINHYNKIMNDTYRESTFIQNENIDNNTRLLYSSTPSISIKSLNISMTSIQSIYTILNKMNDIFIKLSDLYIPSSLLQEIHQSTFNSSFIYTDIFQSKCLL